MENKLFSKSLKYGFIVILLTMTGCAEYHKRVLEDTPESKCRFTKTLAKKYGELGKFEQTIMFDEYSADYYYRKAIRSKEGYCVGPTVLEKWDLEKNKIPELAKARDHLIRLLCLGARNVAPEATANAQAHFDCWVEQQAEGWQKDDIAWCRSAFYKNISEVELQLMGGIRHVKPKSMIMFGNNSSHLTKESMELIEGIAHQAKSMNPHRRILLVGRTDRAGDLKHNKELARQRVMMVKKALVQNGVPARFISIKVAGETAGPKVDAHNRRVDVIFLEHK